MAIKKTFLAAGVFLLLSGCANVAEFQPPRASLLTYYKAPASLNTENVKIGKPQKCEYSTTFLWLFPLMAPPVSTTDFTETAISGSYAEYIYFSFLSGAIQVVCVKPYDTSAES